MADATDVLLKACEIHYAEAKQAEDQRATLTNIVLLIASAIVGVVAQKGLSKGLLPLSILLILIGVYGAFVSIKQYQRRHLHLDLVDGYFKKIAKLHPTSQLVELSDQVRVEDKQSHPILSKLHVNHLWIALHLVIASGGIILATILLTR